MPFCPKCNKELETERGVKSHYGQVHEGTIRNTTKCRRCGEDFYVWPSSEENRIQCSSCYKEFGVHNDVREKIRERMEGREIEWADKISDSISGENHPFFGLKGDEHPAYGSELSEEGREKIIETHKGHMPYGGTNWITVEETGHKVRSSWEGDIDKILHESSLPYEYEPHQLKLSDGRGYLPDFVVDNRIIIEVKGWADEISKEKCKMVAEEFSEYSLVVVGSDVGTGTHIPWDRRESLISVLIEVY